jgi:hypothetical protein
VSLILDVDHTPSVLAATNSLALDDDVAFRTNDRKRNDAADTLVKRRLFFVVVLVINGIEADVVVLELAANLHYRVKTVEYQKAGCSPSP